MTGTLVDRRDLAFVLYEQLDVAKLAERPMFASFSQSDFEMVLGQALEFAEQKLAPTNPDGDLVGARFEKGQVSLPPSFHKPLQLLAEQGWISATDDPAVGGQGLPMVIFTAANEMFHAANTSLQLYTGLAHGAGKLIELFGTEGQKARYLEKLYTYQWAGSMCLTEPGAGSDLAHITTRAERIDDTRYRITGQKIFITGGEHDLTENIVHPVLARVEGDPEGVKGISIFVVPKHRVDDSGQMGVPNDVACVGIEHKMGLKGSATCQLSFGDNGGCVGELLGQRCQGIPIMFHMMNEERLNVGVEALGLSSTAYLHALAYARERLQGTDIRHKGQSTALLPILQHPDIRHALLWKKAYVEGLRALNYYTAFCIDLRNAESEPQQKKLMGGLVELLTPVCKAYSSDRAWEICAKAIQVFGGYGYCRDYHVEQFARDCKITSLYEGTNGIQAIDLLQRKLGLGKGAVFAYLTKQIDKAVEDGEKEAKLRPYAEKLREAKNHLIAAAQHLQSLMERGKIPEAFVSATPFLELLGDTLLGWMHLWQLTLAQRKLAALPDQKNDEATFYAGKIHTARFFLDKILPLQEGKARSIRQDSFSPLEIEDRAFGAEATA